MIRQAGRGALVLLVLTILLALLPAGCAQASPVTGSPTSSVSTATTSPVPSTGSASTPATSASATEAATDPAPTAAVTPAGSASSAGSTALPTAATSVATTGKSTPAATSASTVPPTTAVPAACTISVVCHTAVAYGNKIVPVSGIILAPVRVPLQAGDTVMSVLVRAITVANPKMRGGNIRVIGGAYVSGIGNDAMYDAMTDMLYEKDCGPESGWLYYIGGTYVSDGASRRIVQAGDIIEWKYTCASGRDLG